MATKDLTITFMVDQTPKEVFDAINNVRGWWSEGVEGGTKKLNDEFVYRHGDIHYSKHKLTEVIPNQKVVWLTTDSRLNFTKDKSEWTGTKISFEVVPKGDKTQFRFVHHGLVPEVECFDACSKGWGYYIKESLRRLITEGKGLPDIKESKTVKNGSMTQWLNGSMAQFKLRVTSYPDSYRD